MNIPFKINDSDNTTEGWFELPVLSDCYVDIKMKGTLPHGRKFNVKIYDDAQVLVYSNIIRMCENMGLYITLGKKDKKKQENFIIYSQKK